MMNRRTVNAAAGMESNSANQYTSSTTMIMLAHRITSGTIVVNSCRTLRFASGAANLRATSAHFLSNVLGEALGACNSPDNGAAFSGPDKLEIVVLP